MSDLDAATIVAGLPLAEKVRLLSGRDFWHLEPVPSVGLPAVMVTDGPHGLRKQVGHAEELGLGEAAPATCFPTASGLAASWDEVLLGEVGVALGRECRAEDVAVLLGPGVNLKRHPAGGRNFEYLSEDPHLAGRLAAALIEGVQSQGVGTSLKHLAANHQETFRMVTDTIVDERTLRELELTAFEIAVRRGSPWTVMCAYNRLNGEFCADSRWLLTDVLRDEWGFEGVVVTDWGAVDDRILGIEAGLDLEMPGNGGAWDADVIAAVRSGRLAEADVDRAAERVVDLVLRAQSNVTSDDTFDADAHHELARRAAAAATVLLTNDGILPLSAVSTVAVVGSFAEHPRYQGAGSSQVAPTRLDPALASFRSRLGAAVTYAAGYDPVTGDTTDQLVADAVAAATEADVTIVFAGLPGSYESEGFDRQHLRLPDGHTRLIEAVLEVDPRAIVVLSNGAPVELPWAERPAALVEAYLAGQASGSAIVDVLFGDREPGGRLAESFPVRAADLAADRWFPGGRQQVEHREGLYVGYRFHDTAGVPARFAFGHGLSYTTFRVDEVAVTGSGQRFTVRAQVTNTGERPGSEVIQVYVRDVVSTVHRPAKELRGFAKVHLEPGASEVVSVELGPRAFATYDVEASSWQVEAGTFEVLIGTSSVAIHEAVSIEVISSSPAPTPSQASAGLVADDAEFDAMLDHPVPRPGPLRPFHRNSAVADLDTTRLGRLVKRAIVWAGRRQTGAVGAEHDEATRRMFEAVIVEAPLRGLVVLSGGRVSFRQLDTLIDLLNGRPLRALRRVLRRGSPTT
ncbi:glycoside hydrolase family 3 C-terminal domain-containing protein [Nitriliruptor alkaliphilus]|uniref:glycoside hydrolase family 3 C-terminal domain-containing protein n=1 Tax=Nitriliruptor alkaliphilus TaxID=427918 RepID=UPI00069890F0|nr:glycoside hydrolase family 3 C-terminal domain-containing protein [Nitriliruptor alkaliphilus]